MLQQIPLEKNQELPEIAICQQTGKSMRHEQISGHKSSKIEL